MKKRFAVLLPAAAVIAWSSAAHAAEGMLPIRVNLVSCGATKADLPKACAADERCCVFLPPEVIASLDTPQSLIIDLGSPKPVENLPLYVDPSDPYNQYTE